MLKGRYCCWCSPQPLARRSRAALEGPHGGRQGRHLSVSADLRRSRDVAIPGGREYRETVFRAEYIL